MRSRKSRVFICECKKGSEPYVQELILYFCEYFERKQHLYSVFPDIAMVIEGDGCKDIKIPLKHKEDIIRYNEWRSLRKKVYAELIPYCPGDRIEGEKAGRYGVPVLMSGRRKDDIPKLVSGANGLYFDDYCEFECCLEYINENYKLFKSACV
ncbi:MAG: hypothetical protein IKN14_06235 [Clostridiales bacterium]|nr:hypothetical protein [Clostridiales bacterium]